MNLFRFFKCFIIIWLPLASFEKPSSVYRFKCSKTAFPVVTKTEGIFGKRFYDCLKYSLKSTKTVKAIPVLRRMVVLSNDKKFHFEKSAKSDEEKQFSSTVDVEKNAHTIGDSSDYRLRASINVYKNQNKNKYDGKKGKKWRGRITYKREEPYDEIIGRKTKRKLLMNIPSAKPIVMTQNEAATLKTTGTKVNEHGNLTASIKNQNEESVENSKMNDAGALGGHLGAPCEKTCSEKLIHAFCDPAKKTCECEDKYPVQIGLDKGCEKPKQLGDQCFYDETCSYFDSNAECTQIDHNAICQCKPGFHTVASRKGLKKSFCSEDVVEVSADLTKLLGVATGIAVLTGLLCFVLRLFSSNRYSGTRHYGNANLAPPLLFSSDNQWINGIPLTVQGRSSTRSSQQRSTTSLVQNSRKKGFQVPASRAGAARAAAILLIPCHLQSSKYSESEAEGEEVQGRGNEIDSISRIDSRRLSLNSVHSTSSSQKSMSYSARRFERENQQREQKAALRAARDETARQAIPITPSPNSNEDVLLIDTLNNEENFACVNSIEKEVQSEPVGLLCQKGNGED